MEAFHRGRCFIMFWSKIKKTVRGALPEVALCIGLLAAVFAYAVPVSAQEQLADKLTRLHVIAHSDSEADQALKLAVRDRIIEVAGYEYGHFEGEIDDELLALLQKTAQEEVLAQGFLYPVTVTRERTFFDTRHYDGFSLPAGYYDAVRVVIGDGEGQNWWCVLFPPLCLGAAEQDIESVALGAGLTDEDVALIREDGTGYVVRFKLAELWGNVRHWIES